VRQEKTPALEDQALAGKKAWRSAEVEAFFYALHAFEQFVHGQLLVRHVLEEMYNIASHVDDRGFDAADALAGVRGVGLNRSDLGAYRPEVLNNQIIGAHLLSPFLRGTGDSH
jgi:hypothetical protein